MLNKDILIYIYNGLTQYDHALIGKIRQTCKLFSYYPKGIVKVTRDVNAVYYKLLVNGKEIPHRGPGMYPFTDGPAVEWADGDKAWYVHGEQHRIGGPALELANGDKYWGIHDKRHREDGPAVERADGTKEWWVRGKRHREDGPAVERADGTKEWWVRDKQYSESEFNSELKRLSC